MSKPGSNVRRRFRNKHSNPICHYCKKPLAWLRVDTCDPIWRRIYSEGATMDHIIPQSKGGRHEASNLVVACFPCNQARGNTPYDVFMASLSSNSFQHP